MTQGFDRQMIILSIALFILTVLALLYFNSRQKRREISRRYTAIKSVTDRIFDEMRTGVAAVGADGRIALANSAFEGIFGLRDSVSKAWDEVLPAAELALERLAPDRESSRETELTLKIRGKESTLLLATSRVGSDHPDITGIVVVVYDITRLREFERRSARRKRLSEMGDLAAGVAHEIRNPLNTISIAVQRLAGEFARQVESADFRSLTDQIRSETKRLNDIITRFLALAREEQKRRETVDLSAFLREMVEFVTPEASELRIDITLDADQALQVSADRDSLKQVFINLFNNAKEALGGAPGRIAITASRAEGSVLMTFADSGPGIAPEQREKIFTPYYTTKEAGTGLGLPTVHRIVSEMDGDVRVEAAEGGGARLVVTLPGR
jgi:two-component system sensor histidine kinase PilS (NtrC family)